MKIMTMQKVMRYGIIETTLWNVQEAVLQEAFTQNIGSNLQIALLQGRTTDFFVCRYRCILHFLSM